MSLTDKLEQLGRVVSRETLGAVVRAKAARADKAQRVAWLMQLAQGRNVTPLDREDFRAAASTWAKGDAINEVAATLHAIADVESGGIGGFDERGRLTILVEPHIFSRASNHAFDRSHPWISYPTWVRYEKNAAPPAAFPVHPYSYGMDDRYGLLAMMAELDLEAACCACSGGRFQQLIYGWKDLRYGSGEALFAMLANSERDQLDVLMTYIVAHGLKAAVIARDWRAVARGYNGPGQVDLYAGRMAEAFKRRNRLYS